MAAGGACLAGSIAAAGGSEPYSSPGRVIGCAPNTANLGSGHFERVGIARLGHGTDRHKERPTMGDVYRTRADDRRAFLESQLREPDRPPSPSTSQFTPASDSSAERK